ncbi:hypothetical protein CEXT_478861 [Caerostris extrusa]|uniref:Uncharacterized protein n=1 Tax=Caerostris extrusa TaxID=172846 RepID=A0AAV4TUW9_CAEEX|nr:hypothetical protein CEXT_478861 [Caerostris extrusa]
MELPRQERPPLRIKTILGVHSRCSRVTPRCQCLREGVPDLHCVVNQRPHTTLFYCLGEPHQERKRKALLLLYCNTREFSSTFCQDVWFSDVFITARWLSPDRVTGGYP